ncbi:hypothetical protein Golob_004397 [Gossypium lobatum]|uniref:Uncharacterized protein n=1 Tax=Gossypium lobatum TaxID=34289 RepID=A0A7J8N1B3_9ROSI|nr:hypothetical protein [Gossypium lobatum]
MSFGLEDPSALGRSKETHLLSGNSFIISSHFNPMFDGVLEVLVSLKKYVLASTKNSTVMFKENIPPNSLEFLKDYQKEDMGSGNTTIGVRTVGGKSGGRCKVLLSKSGSSIVELINSQIKQGACNNGPKEAGKQLESKEASQQGYYLENKTDIVSLLESRVSRSGADDDIAKLQVVHNHPQFILVRVRSSIPSQIGDYNSILSSDEKKEGVLVGKCAIFLKEMEVGEELDFVLLHEELLWKQKSSCDWLNLGD